MFPILVRNPFGLGDYFLILVLVQDILLFCVSHNAMFLANNPTFNATMKQIDLQFHFVRDMVEDGKVNLEKVNIIKNIANALTKLVGIEKFRWCS